ncbi:hypothetical protein QU870_31215, partial [Escherichia coli]|nr:hypothetical protein [Escherichia coli]
ASGYQPAFYGREQYELTFRSSRRSEIYVKSSNISDDMSMYLALSKAGYGPYHELVKLDTPELFDMLEFENISADIQHYEMEKARNGDS